MSLKVVIVEDNPTTVLSLVKTIDWDVMKCEVAGTAGDGESGGVMIRQLKPDIVLTDIRMPVKSGLDMIADVREDMPDCRRDPPPDGKRCGAGTGRKPENARPAADPFDQ